MESKAKLSTKKWFVILFIGIFVFVPAFGSEQNFERVSSDESFLLKVDSEINSSELNQNTVKKATKLTLDLIPSEIHENELITFSGRLMTEDQEPVSGVLVYIKEDDPFWKDEDISFAVTDSLGRFTVVVPAKDWDSSSSGASEVYAEFKGDLNYLKSKTPRQKITVYQSFEREPTKLILDPINISSALVGEEVLFTGTLTSFGNPVSGVTVSIQEDTPILGDGLFAEGTTDSDGKFSIKWKIRWTDPFEKTLEMYAKFTGNSKYYSDQSENQSLDVLKSKTWITLNKIPSSANVGEFVTFTGTLQFEKGNTEGAIVYIKDEDFLTRDDLLTTAWVDSDGSFSAAWLAKKNDPNNAIEVYAEFKGDRFFSRSTTCGAGCSDTQKIAIDPTPISYPAIGPEEYLELYYALNFEKTPHVAIVPSPDSYEQVKGAIIPVKEGVLMWSEPLIEKFGGMWNVEFEIVSKDSAFFNKKPDVVINLVTEEDDRKCLHWGGYVRVYLNRNPVNTVVCVDSDPVIGNYNRESRTAAHEYAHAIGLGHAFNIAGDLMCSIENGRRTCIGGASSPTEFNLAAIIALYRNDGYLLPNNNISGGVKFNSADYEKIIETANVIEQVELIKDVDGDGILDNFDQCYNKAETFNGYLDSDGCPDEKPKGDTTKITPPTTGPEPVQVPLAIPAPFVDPNQDPQYYVNRYNHESSYKKWVDENFPEYDSIYEAVGLKEPEAIPKIKPAPLPPSPSPEPAPKIKSAPEPPEPSPEPEPIREPEVGPILPTSKSLKVYPCGEGTHEESGKCIPDLNSDWQIFENIQNWFNDNIVKPIMSAF